MHSRDKQRDKATESGTVRQTDWQLNGLTDRTHKHFMRDPTGRPRQVRRRSSHLGNQTMWHQSDVASAHTHTHTYSHRDKQAASNIVTMKSNQALAWRPASVPSPMSVPGCGHTKSWPKAKTTTRQALSSPSPSLHFLKPQSKTVVWFCPENLSLTHHCSW